MKYLICTLLSAILTTACSSSQVHQTNASHEGRRDVASAGEGADDSVYLTAFSSEAGSNYRIEWLNVGPVGQKKFYQAKLIVHVNGYGRCGARLKLVFHGRTAGAATISLANIFDDAAIDPCFSLGQDKDVQLRLPSPVLETRDLKQIQIVSDDGAPQTLVIPPKPTDGDGDL